MVMLAASVYAAPESTTSDVAVFSDVTMPSAVTSLESTSADTASDVAVNHSEPARNNTLADERQPTNSALSSANQQLLSRNAQLQRQVNDLQTQVNVLIYESKGQLFLYGALTVLISLLTGVFVSWLVFRRRGRW